MEDNKERRNLKPVKKESGILSTLVLIGMIALCVVIAWELNYLDGFLYRAGLEDHMKGLYVE